MYYIYLIQDQKSKRIYIGYTSDLKTRFAYHQQGRGSSFTSKYKDWKLIYYEAYQSEQDARTREISLKKYGQSIKHLKHRLKNSLTN